MTVDRSAMQREREGYCTPSLASIVKKGTSTSAWMPAAAKAEGAIEDMRKTRAEMLESVRKLVAEYSEFQRRRPDLPQGNFWGLSQDELEQVVAAFQLEGHSDAEIDLSNPAPAPPKPQIH